jgi:hypothetical protein
MNRPPSRGIKLTTVIFAVVILTVLAMLSNNAAAGEKGVIITLTSEELSK